MKLTQLTALAITCALLTPLLGCGAGSPPLRQSTATRTNSLSTSAIGQINGQATVEGEYNCPATSQITPLKTVNQEGKGTYQVCTHATNPAKILMHGKTFSSTGICIIPLRMTSSDKNTALNSAYLDSFGNPLMSCAQATSSGLQFVIDATLYNAIFVADSADGQALSWCVKQRQSSLCPATISWGMFR